MGVVQREVNERVADGVVGEVAELERRRNRLRGPALVLGERQGPREARR